MFNKWEKIIFVILIIFVGIFTISLCLDNFDFNFKTLTNDSGFDSGVGSSSGGGSSISSGSGSSSSNYSSLNIGLEEFVWILIVAVPICYYLILFGTNSNLSFRGWKGDLTFLLLMGLLTLYGIFMIFSVILFPVIHIIRWFVFIIVLIYVKRKYNTFLKIYNHHYSDNIDKFVREDVSDDIFTKYKLPDKSVLKKDFYDIYVKIQKAWSNNDIEKARDVLSDNLFNMYKIQILTMVKKNRRNAMSDFEFVSAYINDVSVNNAVMNVEVMMEVYCKDYMIDIKTDKVLRGDSNRINHYYYLLSFTKDIEADNNICPNCGAKISSDKSVKCDYCDTIINKKSNKFVLSNKKMIKQEVGKE